MSTNTVVIPQPLTGTEIKRGIAVRMTQGLPVDIAEPIREKILAGLGKTCSLMAHTAYAKFKADWQMGWDEGDEASLQWWVNYELDDFGRVTRGGIGNWLGTPLKTDKPFLSGVIAEVPPDRFRRETDQPIPKPMELKLPEPEKSSFSKSVRGLGKRRDV